jgi:hypothetical protein
MCAWKSGMRTSTAATRQPAARPSQGAMTTTPTIVLTGEATAAVKKAAAKEATTSDFFKKTSGFAYLLRDFSASSLQKNT